MTEELETQVNVEPSEIDQSLSQESSEPLSIEDELRNAIKASKAPDEDEKNETGEVKEKSSRRRDDSGKFAKNPPKEELWETIDIPPISQTEQPKAPTIPQAWNSAERLAKWNSIPPEIQAEISKREEEVNRGFTRLDEERNFGKSLKEVINPYMAMINSEGGNPAGAVKQLLNTAYLLRTATPQQKGAILQQIAKQFGADMSSNQSPAAYIDPHVQTLQQRIDQLEFIRQQEAQAQEAQIRQSAVNEVQAFASDPANSHYYAVKDHMAKLLSSKIATSLKDAYEQAIYTRPDIRSTIIAQQQADAEAKRLADIKTKTNAAKNASSSVNGAPGISVPNKGSENLSLDEELRRNIRAALH